ncbi:retrovirus-related Pol polyprotein from transposon TNT 1-94 [Senna tora]|uniref:Retrovirus-related Pol polyprotein from transposon TNT 1-94 n=1 Tax=Senna tora TaxID=362788 RepID=A0A834TQK9_9FABA|nr:retrovirus-related Pol polyprotein from transposon TNT 1-94 [Senna tora]
MAGGDESINFVCDNIGLAATLDVGELERTPLPRLNDEHWQTLLNLLNKSESAIHEKMTGASWIIDTGATNHMTGLIEGLSDIKEISRCPVGLPDGSDQQRQDQQFLISLIMCVIQDCTTRMLIGVDERQDGL